MSKTTEVSTASFPLFSILGLIFITLKLTGFIAWSWWWVLSPFWLPIIIVLIVAFILFVIGVVLK